MTFEEARETLSDMLRDEAPLLEAWQDHVKKHEGIPRFLGRTEGATATPIPHSITDRATQLARQLPEKEGAMLVRWFHLKTVGMDELAEGLLSGDVIWGAPEDLEG